MKRITLQRVADFVGVSRMTASRALRDDPKVAIDTKKRVQQAAQELGYRSDVRLSDAMRSIRSGAAPTYRETLGFLLTHPSWLTPEDSQAASQAALLAGYKIECFQAWDYPTPSALARVLDARGIRGLILAPNKVQYQFDMLDGHWDQFSCVMLGSSLKNTGLTRVRPAYFNSAMRCMRRVAELNYDRVAMLVDDSLNERTGRAYSASFAATHQITNRKWSRQALYLNASSASHGWQAWLKDIQPNLLIIQSDRDLPSVQDLALQEGFDLSVVALNVGTSNTLTGMRYPYLEIAKTAVQVLIGQLQSEQFGLLDYPSIVSIPGRWQSGKTAPPYDQLA